jgi:hypothetical protein
VFMFVQVVINEETATKFKDLASKELFNPFLKRIGV